MSISFETTIADGELIRRIVARAVGLFAVRVDRLALTMDLTACHVNGCPLALRDLLDAPQADFLHDVCGIVRHISRDDGQLRDCFMPRYAASNGYNACRANSPRDVVMRSRFDRLAASPALLATADAATLRGVLTWNDPNGEYDGDDLTADDLRAMFALQAAER